MPELPDAVVLAGGRSRRMAGADKTALPVGGRPLLDRVLAAAPGRAFVVGPPRPTERAVTWLREDPPFGGPVAGIAAALPHVTTTEVVVLAGDMPFVRPPVVDALRTALAAHPTADGAVLRDDTGRPQHLCGVWRTAALTAAVAALDEVAGASVRRLVATLHVVETPVTADGPAPWLDCDTPEDLRLAEEAL